MQRLNEAYAVAAALGVTRMIVHNGWLPFIYFKSWQAEKGAAFWQEFLKDKASNFHIYVENVLEDEPYMLLDMMKQIDNPHIKLCLDTGHANATTSPELPVEKWIEVLGPHIGHFHLHNNDGTGDSHNAFDCGSMNMDSIFSAIDTFCDADVTLTIEARDARACLYWLEKNNYLCMFFALFCSFFMELVRLTVTMVIFFTKEVKKISTNYIIIKFTQL